MKVLWIDLETSGLDPVKHGILQIAMLFDIDGVVVEHLDLHMNPVGKELDAQALSVNGFTPEMVAGWPPALEARKDIKKAMERFVNPFDRADKFLPAGFNVGFDIPFLEQLWTEAGDKYLHSFFGYAALDPFKVQPFLEWAGISKEPSRRNLETLATHYGIALEGAHNALADIRATREIALKMREMIKGEKA
jgi:DNA polymerase-3 subunit epsilon